MIALLVLTIHVMTRKDATNTETALWTFILFAIGLAASYYFGKKSVSEAAAEMVRPQARAAGRRLLTLGKGIGSMREMLRLQHASAKQDAAERNGSVSLESVNLACATLEIEIDQQMRTVVDALEDWRHFDPAIANELIENEGEPGA